MTADPLLKALAVLLSEAKNNNPGGFDVNLAVGEVMVGNISYQLVLTLYADKSMWHHETDPIYFSCTKQNPSDGSVEQFIKAYMKND